MVNNVLFTETDLPDLLNAQGFLTEEECYTMRQLPNRKDRIRTLLSVMKGRDKKTIEGFLKYLQKDNPDIVENVYKTYTANKSNGMRCKLCAFCKMKTNVDIKDVVDSIWSICVIPDGLYNEIIVSQKPAGAQEVTIYWDRLADTCNSHTTDLRTKAVEALVQCLTVKNYSHIANTLTSQLLNRNSLLKCRCKVVPLRNMESFICSTATSLSPTSTPRSSCEVLAEDGDLTRPKLSVMSELSASVDSIYEEEMVDQFIPEGTKAILKEVAKSLPSLVWDVATRLQGEGGGPPIPSSKDPAPIWCVCTNCREMDTDASRVCCGMRPDLCHINMPEMRLTICEPRALQVQQIYLNDIFARHAATNKAMRHAAYRQYILFHYGRLGHGVRRPVPSCCTWYIRDRFPDPNHSYVGYVPSW